MHRSIIYWGVIYLKGGQGLGVYKHNRQCRDKVRLKNKKIKTLFQFLQMRTEGFSYNTHIVHLNPNIFHNCFGVAAPHSVVGIW